MVDITYCLYNVLGLSEGTRVTWGGADRILFTGLRNFRYPAGTNKVSGSVTLYD